jgi:hypothetical protein
MPTEMRPQRHAAILVAVAVLACSPRDTSLPEPAVVSRVPSPALTPIPAPDPACIAQMGRGVPRLEPRQIFHVSPRFPVRNTPTRFSSTQWSGVVEIGPDGRVTKVRVLRPIKTQPPWPEWENSIPDALRRSRYEPVCVDGHPVRTELHVTMEIRL